MPQQIVIKCNDKYLDVKTCGTSCQALQYVGAYHGIQQCSFMGGADISLCLGLNRKWPARPIFASFLLTLSGSILTIFFSDTKKTAILDDLIVQKNTLVPLKKNCSQTKNGWYIISLIGKRLPERLLTTRCSLFQHEISRLYPETYAG